ncbi:hypothetical protein [Kribbella swartbergensis]
MKQILEVIVSALWTVPTRWSLVPVSFGRKSLDASPDECPVNVSGLHRFQRSAAGLS